MNHHDVEVITSGRSPVRYYYLEYRNGTALDTGMAGGSASGGVVTGGVPAGGVAGAAAVAGGGLGGALSGSGGNVSGGAAGAVSIGGALGLPNDGGDASGCSCRVVGSPREHSPASLLALAALALNVTRRRTGTTRVA